MCERSQREESPGTNVTECFMRPFLLGPVFFWATLPCSAGYQLERGGMALHDSVGINCKKSATTEYQDADIKYIGIGVYVDDYVCVI